MIKKLISLISFLGIFLLFLPATIHAQSQDNFYQAVVTEITNQGKKITDYGSNPFQDVVVKFTSGSRTGLKQQINYGDNISLTPDQLLKISDKVVVVSSEVADGSSTYQIVDKYRLDSVVPIIILFFLLVLILSQWKGLGSIFGMVISLGIILRFIVPQILAGHDPLTVSIVGCLIIMVTTIYLAHGFSVKTTIAVLSTFVTLFGIGFLSNIFVKSTFLTGLGSEDAASLRFGITQSIDFRGLLLGGILIGALGVLDDVTTGLSVSVFELAKANPKMDFKQLFISGLAIGKEHIASLVNTLVLAYAGSALPIFLIIILNVNHYPAWLILNDGLIIEEVVRTLAGSIGLVAAVPLTTFIAALYVSQTHKTAHSSRKLSL